MFAFLRGLAAELLDSGGGGGGGRGGVKHKVKVFIEVTR